MTETSALFRDPQARATVAGWYDKFLARSPQPAEQRRFPTRFGETHALVAGPEGAPPLVCLHGAMASSAHLLPELGPLLDRFRVYAVDVLGQSVRSADARVPVDGDAYGEWLQDVFDGLGLPRAHLLGVSWGGFVALRGAIYAATRPRVDRLVLVVPAGLVSGPAWAGFTKMGWPMALYRLFPSEARRDRFLRALLTTQDEHWVAYLGEAFLAYRLDMRVPPLATPAELEGFARPVLAFGATEDLSFPGERLLARLKELVPHAETELLEGCRHSPPTDDAFRARLCARVARFLQAS